MRRRRVLLTLAAVVAAAAGIVQLREHMVVSQALMPIIFDHHDHGSVKCVTCHHNFVDDTGKTACYFCHKQARALALAIQDDFHEFCRSCHLMLRRAGRDSGPVRQCGGCHGDGDWKPTRLASQVMRSTPGSTVP